jgi:hypothetical protein
MLSNLIQFDIQHHRHPKWTKVHAKNVLRVVHLLDVILLLFFTRIEQ